ncbi:hypothetical protein CHS0354_042848, partial [Potamilus streckersoni]
MRAQGYEIKHVYEIQNGGRNKYVLYPKDYTTPIFPDKDLIEVKWSRAMIREINPIVRDIEGSSRGGRTDHNKRASANLPTKRVA